MTDDELHDAILADPEAKALADAGRDADCAALIGPRLPPILVPTRLWEVPILRILGGDRGDAFLAAIEDLAATDRKMTRIVRGLRLPEGGIDLANEEVRTMLDQLAAAGKADAGDVAKLKAAAERPRAPTAADVSRALIPYRQGQGLGA